MEIEFECEDDLLFKSDQVVLVEGACPLWQQVNHSVEGWRDWLLNLCCHEKGNRSEHCKVWSLLSSTCQESEIPVSNITSEVHGLLLVAILLLVEHLNGLNHLVSVLRLDHKLVGIG